MDVEERTKWEDKAEMDRERFEKEKMRYRGPWTVPIGHRKSRVRLFHWNRSFVSPITSLN